MECDNEGPEYVYRVGRDQFRAHIPISGADDKIIHMYKDVFRRPLIHVIHAMIGQSAKCWEEKHEQTIQDLNERTRTQARITLAYLNKYGPITKKTPMEQGRSEAVPEEPEAGQEQP